MTMPTFKYIFLNSCFGWYFCVSLINLIPTLSFCIFYLLRFADIASNSLTNRRVLFVELQKMSAYVWFVALLGVEGKCVFQHPIPAYACLLRQESLHVIAVHFVQGYIYIFYVIMQDRGWSCCNALERNSTLLLCWTGDSANVGSCWQ